MQVGMTPGERLEGTYRDPASAQLLIGVAHKATNVSACRAFRETIVTKSLCRPTLSAGGHATSHFIVHKAANDYLQAEGGIMLC